jgi:hypothetical protein
MENKNLEKGKVTSLPVPKIGVKIVQSKKIGVSKHEEIYPIITVFAILFLICWVMALLNLIGLN